MWDAAREERVHLRGKANLGGAHLLLPFCLALAGLGPSWYLGPLI